MGLIDHVKLSAREVIQIWNFTFHSMRKKELNTLWHMTWKWAFVCLSGYYQSASKYLHLGENSRTW